MEHKFLYKFKQQKDKRDHAFSVALHPTDSTLEISTITVPIKNKITTKSSKVSPTSYIIPNLPAIMDQGQLGSCAANAVTFNMLISCPTMPFPSRLMEYDMAKMYDNSPMEDDVGTYLSSVYTMNKNYGVISELTFPYMPSNYYILPTLPSFNQLKQFSQFQYVAIGQTLLTFKNWLSSGKAITLGIMVYSSFMKAKKGIIPTPIIKKETLLGGHAITIVGYDDATKRFTFANSWNTNWGINGYGSIPYLYILNPALTEDCTGLVCLVQ
jgi:C1A family cysteine protease